jgi:hypothetical protein
MMSLVGLNLTAQWLDYASWSPPVSNATLTPDKLESAVAQAAAQLIWIGKGSPEITLPGLFSSTLLILKRGKLAHPTEDSILEMERLMPFRRSLHSASMSV